MDNVQSKKTYVVNVPEIGEIDLISNIAQIEITKKVVEENASKGCLSTVARFVIWLVSIPNHLMDLIFTDIAVSGGGGSCGFTITLWICRFIWYGVLIFGTYGIVPILYLICVSVATMDTNEEKLICLIHIKDGRNFTLKLSQEDYKLLKGTIQSSENDYSDALDENPLLEIPEEYDSIFEEIDEKLEILIDCKKSNLFNDEEFNKKISDLEMTFFGADLIAKLTRAKDSGVMSQEDFDKAKAEIENKNSWDLSQQVALGLFYLQSTNELIKERGIHWLQKSSEAGFRDATTILGILHRSENSGVQDLPKAVDYFLKSEQAGCPQSAYFLGLMFENGEGTEKNFEKSQEYYKIALERGFQAAQEKISEQKPEENIDS